MADKRSGQVAYEAEVEALKKFCDENTEFEVYVLDERYPLRVQYVPTAQIDCFGVENVDENGELCDLCVTAGLTTSVKSTLRFKLPAQLLKKLIRRAERVGELYYHAFREAADPEEEETRGGEKHERE